MSAITHPHPTLPHLPHISVPRHAAQKALIGVVTVVTVALFALAASSIPQEKAFHHTGSLTSVQFQRFMAPARIPSDVTSSTIAGAGYLGVAAGVLLAPAAVAPTASSWTHFPPPTYLTGP
jgi:hypothetical protein